ncbi:Putative alpha/beta hydrolase-3 [Septoria linicola]|uniref:Alpha/beta hydrolase-3 n=1 Tax=Septoria linicola TaxID=215465 RepID=A0A9Q9AVA2_9PEZI|nr:Putative alpha/beta hydrolase-3 [Septoria linicola]
MSSSRPPPPTSSPPNDEAIEMDGTPQSPGGGGVDRRKSFLPNLLPHSYTDTRDKRQYIAVNNRPRWMLHLQATFWRVLMQLGMFFHRFASPRPPKPSFWRMIDSTVSGSPGQICLYFYTPPDYDTQKRLWTGRPESFDSDEEEMQSPRDRQRTRMSIGSIGGELRRKSRSARRWGGYPVIINFHGGGFTLGSPHDDARWAGTVVQELNALVVSVDYRRAPEYPFPTAVEDGVDAVLWLHKHADELGLDRSKILLSGFSSGGNMAFTVPLRLYDQLTGFHREEATAQPQDGSEAGKGYTYRPSSADDSASSSSTRVPVDPNNHILDPNGPPPPVPGNLPKNSTTFREQNIEAPEIQIRGIVPWYPSLDYTRTREERRATGLRADQELPAFFTNLFDDSYLHPPKDVTLDSPYLSPAVAPTDLLRNALPDEIIMHTCEYDMLLDEGQMFYNRLTSDEIGKNVTYTMVPGVPHGWDKAPNPLRPTPGVREYYLKACKEMRRILGERRVDSMAMPRQSVVN